MRPGSGRRDRGADRRGDPAHPARIARANTGSRTLNIVLLAVFSPIWVPVALALAAAALAVYVAIWAVIAALWAVDAVLVLMPFAGLASLTALIGGGNPATGAFVLGITLIVSGVGLFASFGVFGASRLLFQLTRSFARWVAGLFVRVSGDDAEHGEPARPAGDRTPDTPAEAGTDPSDTDSPGNTPILEEGARNA